MTAPADDLDRVQRWMQAVIMHPGGVAYGVDSQLAQSEIPLTVEQIEQVVTRSKTLSAVERLGIYANAYYARLRECLQEEFPALRHALGNEAFDALAIGYLKEYPSTSYTLADLGRCFPTFLAESFPGNRASAEEPERYRVWGEFLAELARLERLYSEVFDGPGVEGEQLLDAEQLQALAPEAWPHARLVPAPCLKLIAFRYPVHEFISAIRRKEDPAVPEPAPTWLAVTRKNFVIRRLALSRPQFELLGALIAGNSVAEAIRQAAEYFEGNDEQLCEKLREWFAEWSGAGFFVGVQA